MLKIAHSKKCSELRDRWGKNFWWCVIFFRHLATRFAITFITSSGSPESLPFRIDVQPFSKSSFHITTDVK
jgi:hypothetical protein